METDPSIVRYNFVPENPNYNQEAESTEGEGGSSSESDFSCSSADVQIYSTCHVNAVKGRWDRGRCHFRTSKNFNVCDRTSYHNFGTWFPRPVCRTHASSS